MKKGFKIRILIILLAFIIGGCGGGSSTSSQNPNGNAGRAVTGIVTLSDAVAQAAKLKGKTTVTTNGSVNSQATATGTVPVSGARCFLEGTDKSGTTDQNGLFTITDVSPGSYILICKKTVANGNPYVFLKTIEVGDGQNFDIGTAEITLAGKIQGVATIAGQTDHTGIKVYIPGTSLQSTTDATGAYLITSVPEGTYELRLENTGYVTISLPTINVSAGQTKLIGEVVLSVSTGASGGFLLENGNQYATSQTITISIAASSNSSLMQLSENPNFVDAKWQTIESTLHYTFSSDGQKRLYIKFADANGLESAPISEEIIVDIAPPASESVTVNSGASTINSTSVTLTLSAADATTSVSQMMISNSSDFVDAEWEAFNTTRSWTLTSGDGTKTVYAKFKDLAGNETTPAVSASVLLDTESPTIPGGSINVSRVGFGKTQISWSAAATATSYNIYWSTTPGVTKSNGTKISNVTSPYTHAGLTAGATYYYVVTAVNIAGESNVSAEQSVKQYFITKIAAGGDYHFDMSTKLARTVALDVDGTVWTWGVWGYGGNVWSLENENLNRYTPIKVSGLIGVTSIDVGSHHTVVLKSDGTVWGWGNNNQRPLGDQPTSYTPVKVSGLEGITAVSAGGDYLGGHTIALKNDGTVWTLGRNSFGQLGRTDYLTTPLQVSGITDVTAVAAGGMHTVALKSDGTVWAWGNNWNGQLGDNKTVDRNTPAQVIGLTNVTAIAAGALHTVALKNDGTVWAWGYNNNYQLGDDTIIERHTPVQVIGLTDVTAIAAGSGHTIALKSDGTVWAWGSNGLGFLGDGTTTNRPTPVRVTGLTGVTAIDAGKWHTVASKIDGTVWAWGSNSEGQLGNSTVSSSLIPIQAN